MVRLARWAFALALVGVVAPAAAPQKPDKIVLGMAISIADAPYYVADAKGYLTAERIEADTSNDRGAQDAVAALATGEMDRMVDASLVHRAAASLH